MLTWGPHAVAETRAEFKQIENASNTAALRGILLLGPKLFATFGPEENDVTCLFNLRDVEGYELLQP